MNNKLSERSSSGLKKKIVADYFENGESGKKKFNKKFNN